MKIVVFDVAAENKGAITILEEFYLKMLSNTEHNFTLVLSVAPLHSLENIAVMHYRWIKKSWFCRLYFDLIIAPQIVRREKADLVISLQNIMIPYCQVKQVLYLQNILPFTEYKYKLSEDKTLWLNQNVVGLLVRKSVKRVSKVIVQANWIKETCSKKLNLPADKFIVQKVENTILTDEDYKINTENLFFYPASSMLHKNHRVIIEAVKKLEDDAETAGQYKVVFTITGKENKNAHCIKTEIENNHLPILLIGELNHRDVLNYYSKSILVFPSTIETVGLPLLEAQSSNTPILVADMCYAHETIGDYQRAEYFEPSNSSELYKKMKEIIRLT